MKIRRFIAAVLAVLALAAFAGCKKHDKDQTDTTGKNDETVSEDNPESTASVADVNADIKSSGYFLGIDLDGWYHWNQTSSGYQKDTTYTASWTKEYNSRGDLVSYITYVLISEGNFSAEKRSYGYTYNSDGTVKEISRSGHSQGTYRYEYDSEKRITKITSAEPSGEVTATLNFSYDKHGRLAEKSDFYGSTVFSYDGKGRLVKSERNSSEAASESFTETFTYKYNSDGDIVRQTYTVKNPFNTSKIITEYEYDERGALIRLTVRDSFGAETEKEYKNDAYGNPVEIKETRFQDGEAGSTEVISYSYEYETAKIAVTGTDGSKTTYEYQKNKSIVTPETE